MGGKTLKFPSRRKYVPPIKEVEQEKTNISQEEHEKRIKMLKEMGLIK